MLKVRTAGNVLLLATAMAGVAALVGPVYAPPSSATSKTLHNSERTRSPQVDQAKCIGLVAAFFAPVLMIVYNLGSRYFASNWRLFLGGWIVPGWWTVLVRHASTAPSHQPLPVHPSFSRLRPIQIDCIGQQQQVWRFPSTYLSGIATLDGLLKLDIALVYLVSTFAVTATGEQPEALRVERPPTAAHQARCRCDCGLCCR